MQLIILGSGSPLPDPGRAGPATLVRSGAGDLLFDCGRGVLDARRRGRFGCRGPARALPDPSAQRSHHGPQRHRHVALDARPSNRSPLAVYGPVGTTSLLQATEAMLELDIGYRLEHHADLTVAALGGGRRMRAGHRAATTGRCGSPRPRPTTPRSAPRSASGSRTGGRSVVIAGDTVPVLGAGRAARRRGHARAHRGAAGPDRDRSALPRLMDVLDYHSSVEDAARTAARNGVGTLVLTHLVPGPQPGTEGGMDRAGGRAHFDGDVVVAEDLLTLEVGPAR